MFGEETILEVMAENKDGSWGKQFQEFAQAWLDDVIVNRTRSTETPEPIPFDETSEADNGI